MPKVRGARQKSLPRRGKSWDASEPEGGKEVRRCSGSEVGARDILKAHFWSTLNLGKVRGEVISGDRGAGVQEGPEKEKSSMRAPRKCNKESIKDE